MLIEMVYIYIYFRGSPCYRVDAHAPLSCHLIREIPDHATFREKEHTLGWLDKLGFFSLFGPMQFGQL